MTLSRQKQLQARKRLYRPSVAPLQIVTHFAENLLPAPGIQHMRSAATASGGSHVPVGVFPRSKASDGGEGGGLGGDGPWLVSSGGIFVRNITPDIGFGRNITPDIGGAALFGVGGGVVLSSGRKLQEVLQALSQLHSVR